MLTDSIVFLTGTVYFAVLCCLALGAYVWYVARGYSMQAHYAAKEKYELHWTNTHWIFGSLVIIGFAMTLLYATQYQDMGILVSMGGFDLLWSRWILLTIVAFVNAYCLTYIMTHESRDVQSAVLLLFASGAYAIFFFATFVTTNADRATLLVFAIVAFLVSAVAYLAPYNKWRVAGSRFHADLAGQPWGAYYHRAYFILLIVYFIGNLLIWCLAQANELTGATVVLDHDGECIAYLVLDAAVFGIFALYMIVLAALHQAPTLELTDKASGSVQFRSAFASKIK